MRDEETDGLLAGRYEDLGLIGTGGMGEVRRVRDTLLERTLAMKIMHARLLDRAAARAWFLDEAQANAQLQHPNIVPVYDLGTLPDGRPWFTMKEVRGRTLAEMVQEVHAVSGDRWEAGADGWTFRRLISAFLSVCRAAAYAHDRGVVHRDLKPNNVMVGELGEVYVVDWGTAKVTGRPDGATAMGELDVVRTARAASDAHRTKVGSVVGTPAYMPPEQARGDVDRVDARSDVYALGAMLYEMLSGRAPYVGDTPTAVLHQVVHSPPLPVGQAASTGAPQPEWATLRDHVAARGGPPLPEELVVACERAMSREPEDRFQTAHALAAEVEGWLDGARRREQALAMTARALEGVEEAEALAARAKALRAESEDELAGIETWQPEEAKAPSWEKARAAAEAERASALRDLEIDQGLYAALQMVPDLPEPHAALAERYRARHAIAEEAHDEEALVRAERRLSLHVQALPAAHPTREACTAYLTGHGALTLVTDPPGAEVLLHRYVEHNRRLVPELERSLGVTPLRAVSLPRGSYLCVLRYEGRADVRYPVEIPRLGHWDGVPPGGSDPAAIWLPPEGRFGPDEIYVPAGWFRAGGDPEAGDARPAQRLWCDAIVMQRFPVTNVQYIAFLDALVAEGREAEALEYVPRERASRIDDKGEMLFARTPSGGFALLGDPGRSEWMPDGPVFSVDYASARAWMAWQAARTGRPWRLPGELEWEKAARGVDSRRFPWGDHFDPSWCHMSLSHQHERQPAPVDSYPVDTSPYGVRGMAGNVRDWCADPAPPVRPPVVDGVVVPPPADSESEHRVLRGGAWYDSERGCRVAGRFEYAAHLRYPLLGFRGCQTV